MSIKELTATLSADTINALVAQKTAILAKLNRATEVEELEAVYADIAFVSELWASLGYGYKAKELCSDLREKCVSKLYSERDYLAGTRKNCRTRRTTFAYIAKLEKMVEAL